MELTRSTPHVLRADLVRPFRFLQFSYSRGPGVAENLIRAENTAVTPIDEIIKFQDESRFHRTVHTLCLHVSNPYGPSRPRLRLYATRSPCFNSARRGVCASSSLTGSSGFCGLGYGRSGGAGSAS